MYFSLNDQFVTLSMITARSMVTARSISPHLGRHVGKFDRANVEVLAVYYHVALKSCPGSQRSLMRDSIGRG
jgi:hypothetical protein